MQPLDFCNLAERLILNEKNAEGFRTAIGRAYYGAFLQARDFLERLSIFLITPNPHREVLALLTGTGDPDIDLVVRLLGTLRDDRNAADYDLGDTRIEDEAVAKQCLSHARDIIAKPNGCRLSATRLAAVTAQIRATVNRLRGLPP